MTDEMKKKYDKIEKYIYDKFNKNPPKRVEDHGYWLSVGRGRNDTISIEFGFTKAVDENVPLGSIKSKADIDELLKKMSKRLEDAIETRGGGKF